MENFAFHFILFCLKLFLNVDGYLYNKIFKKKNKEIKTQNKNVLLASV